MKNKFFFFKKRQRFSENDLESVIQACLNKDQQAQRTLIKLFFGFTKQISMRYGATNQESEEIINDGFLKVFENLNKYDHTKPFITWLRAIIVNTAIDHYRKNQRYTHQVDIDDVEIMDMSEDVISKISSEEILSLVQCLPPAYRMVFTLYVMEGYNHREIADMLGIREGTSKSNLQDARKKLQAMIKDKYPHLRLAYELKPRKVNEN